MVGISIDGFANPICQENDVQAIRMIEVYGGMECSMDGFVRLTDEVIESFLYLFTLLIQLVLKSFPASLAASSCYSYMALLVLPKFVGYELASLYYLMEHFGKGWILCLSSSYIH